MKTLKLSLVVALMAICSSAFAGNMENCCSPNSQDNNATTSIESSDMKLISESGVNEMLKEMTAQVRQRVNDSSVKMILQNMTNQVRQRVRTAPSNGSSL
jgi:hypothetical protein